MKYKLSDIAIKVTDGEHGTVKDNENGQCYLLSCKNIKNGRIEIGQNERRIDNETMKTLNKRTQIEKGDILITTVGTIGEMAMIRDDNIFYSFQRSVGVIKPDTLKVIPKYLYYAIMNEANQINTLIKGAVQKCLFINDLKSLEIDLPDLEAQEKIVRILSALDQKIESNCKQNDLLFSIAEGKFDQIYNSGTRRRLDSILFNIESGSRPRGGAEKIGIPSIGAEKIEKFGIYDYSSEKYIGENYYSNMKRGVLKDKDVLLYKDGAYTGKSSMCLSGFPHAKAAVNEHVFILNTKDNYAQFYLYFCINKKENQEMLHRMASSKAAQPGLNQSEVKSLEVNIVSDADIEKFESEISPFMEKIANNTLQNKTLSGLRDASLPKLMSGEIDLGRTTL